MESPTSCQKRKRVVKGLQMNPYRINLKSINKTSLKTSQVFACIFFVDLSEVFKEMKLIAYFQGMKQFFFTGSLFVCLFAKANNADTTLPRRTLSCQGTIFPKHPLYVVNGKPIANSMTADFMKMLDTKLIQNIEVLKDAPASAIYGSDGINGVIIITTKQTDSPEPVKARAISCDSVPKEYPVNIRIHCGSSIYSDKQPLYIVNGNVINDSTSETILKALDPKLITSINVLTDSLVRTIGCTPSKRALNGVIIITTKQTDFPPKPSCKPPEYKHDNYIL
jgi:TonB-dependent SusC/RagA subfamily outer membrane receptor